MVSFKDSEFWGEKNMSEGMYAVRRCSFPPSEGSAGHLTVPDKHVFSHHNLLKGDQCYSNGKPSNLSSNNVAINNSGYFEHVKTISGDIEKPAQSLHDDDGADKKEGEESMCSVTCQVLVLILIAGCGNVAAGILLHIVQDWEVFQRLPQLVILVPSLLGLKGNVEMTLASRLSTHANLGTLDSPEERKRLVVGNIALIQFQASLVGLLAPLFAIFMGTAKDGFPHVDYFVLILTSGVATANLASLVLGSINTVVIIIARKFRLNPDNIATPTAASLGDVTTMALLAGISQFLYANVDKRWLAPTILGIFLISSPAWGYMARNNNYTRPIVFHGWWPIIGAMLLASGGGVIMEQALHEFKRLAVFQPVINGIGGNLVAIQSSRMGTYLHKLVPSGTLPDSDPKVCIWPWFMFCHKSPHSKMALMLWLIAGPCHLVFVYIIRLVNRKSFEVTWHFLAIYISATLIQIALLLYIGYCLVQFLWTKKLDPDNAAIPPLTAMGDLLGAGLLALAFMLLHQLGDPNAEFLTVDTNKPIELTTLAANITGIR